MKPKLFSWGLEVFVAWLQAPFILSSPVFSLARARPGPAQRGRLARRAGPVRRAGRPVCSEGKDAAARPRPRSERSSCGPRRPSSSRGGSAACQSPRPRRPAKGQGVQRSAATRDERVNPGSVRRFVRRCSDPLFIFFPFSFCLEKYQEILSTF